MCCRFCCLLAKLVHFRHKKGDTSSHSIFACQVSLPKLSSGGVWLAVMLLLLPAGKARASLPQGR
jgi:hypothetical protein